MSQNLNLLKVSFFGRHSSHGAVMSMLVRVIDNVQFHGGEGFSDLSSGRTHVNDIFILMDMYCLYIVPWGIKVG